MKFTREMEWPFIGVASIIENESWNVHSWSSIEYVWPFVVCLHHFFSQSESDDTELRTRSALFEWLEMVLPRKTTLFLSVSWIFTSYSKSGRCIRFVRFCQMKTARFSVVLGFGAKWKGEKSRKINIFSQLQWHSSKIVTHTWTLKKSTSLSKFLWSKGFMIAWSMCSFSSVMFITMPVFLSTAPRIVTSTKRQ